MTRLRIARLAQLTLNVHDVARTAAFYSDALGFGVAATTEDRVRLVLGAQHLELVQRRDAAPYPRPRAANDPWFQHFAIAVADMDVAFARLSRFSPEPITRGGPQLLPPGTGSVTAYKFRDPDGHPLELSHAPGSSRASAALADPNALFLGIDHTALAVGDLEASIAFYTDLGFRIGARLLNQGPEQARLDGLDGATLDIVTMLTPQPGPHVELLHYRRPTSPAAHAPAPDAIAATQTTLALLGGADPAPASCRPDPDGHLLRFITC